MKNSGLTFRYLKNDFPAGLVVFLVALPLCLGIALASGAPLFAGIITGIVGGIVVGALNKSELSVSGPAAGLTVIVLTAITSLGYEAFLLSVVIAGLLQLFFGLVRAGIVGNFFPSSVIRGMLAAIGLILILGQLPVFLGFDTGSLKEQGISLFGGVTGGRFDVLGQSMNPAALGIGLLSLGLMITWEKAAFAKRGAFRFIPAALVAVVFAVLGNIFVASQFPSYALSASYLVNIPGLLGEGELASAFILPDISQWNNPQIYVTAITIAVIASLETLLSVDAVDKMDPLKRESSRNQVLKTQGIGNLICGLIGGLPMTAVIVRSSTNVAAGGKSRMASVVHGVFLILSVLALSAVLNLIPLSALSAVLLIVGYKLTKPALYKMQYKLGKAQFIPFIVTVGTILVTDLLVGIMTGIAVSVYFVLKNNYKLSHSLKQEEDKERSVVSIHLSEHVSFLNKPVLMSTLEQVPPRSRVIIDGSRSRFIDHDALEIIHGFKNKASERSIHLELNEVPHFEHSGSGH